MEAVIPVLEEARDEFEDIFGRRPAGALEAFETEDAETIDGLPFVQLEAVLAYKRIAGRPKDLRHIELIESAGLI